MNVARRLLDNFEQMIEEHLPHRPISFVKEQELMRLTKEKPWRAMIIRLKKSLKEREISKRSHFDI